MTPTSHRDDVQGLRAVAVLLVALGHAGVSFLQGGFVGVDVFFVLSGFLITGVLLSSAVTTGSASLAHFYVRRGRRILPAAALTLIVTDLVASHLLNLVRAREIVQDSIWASLFAANIHFAHQGTDYFARGQPPSAIQHFWSLAVEEQFYVVWPVLLALVLFGFTRVRRSPGAAPLAQAPPTGRATLRLRIVVMLILIGSLAWSIYYTASRPAAAYFSPLARAWELALGAALAVGASRVRRCPTRWRGVIGWLGLVAVGIAAVMFSDGTPFPGYAAVLPTVGAAFVIAAGLGDHARWAVGRLLAVAPLRYVGDRSYAFYLWHWPVLIIADLYEGRQLSVGVKLALLAFAFLLSVGSYRFFENPIRRGRPLATGATARIRQRLEPYGIGTGRHDQSRSSLSKGGLLLWPASGVAVLLVATVTLSSLQTREDALGAAAQFATPGYLAQQQGSGPSGDQVVPGASAGALPAVIAAVEAARRGAPIPQGLRPPASELLNFANPDVVYQLPGGCTPASDGQTTSQVCRLGRTSSARTIVVIGDSHAEMWMPPVLKMAEQDGWGVVPLIKSGCTPLTWVSGSSLPACRAWYAWAVRQAQSLRPGVTVIAPNYGAVVGPSAATEQRAIIALSSSLAGSSKHVVLLADNDAIGRQPVDCLLARGATMGTCTSTRTPEQFQLNDDLARLAKDGKFAYLATRGWFCFGNQCPMVVGHTIVYRDLNHITATYALELTQVFRTAFSEATGAAPAGTGGLAASLLAQAPAHQRRQPQ